MRTERLKSLCQKSGEKDQSGAHGEGRAEGEGRVHIFITKLMEEEEEGRPSKACPGPSDLLAPLDTGATCKLHQRRLRGPTLSPSGLH